MSVDKNMPILIVDDYKTMLKIVRNLLNQLGFTNIEEATDGTMALQKLSEKPYKLIISDWNMQPMSGLDLLKKVRADTKTAAVPFIMVTAESKAENIMIAKQAGVNNYIVKPFNAETLKTKLSAVLGPI
jgi:two-component system, chemotaxis family, chemotaxis protein CheY